LFVNKNGAAFSVRCFFKIFFNSLNAKTAAITSSFSKFSKSKYICVFFFCQYHLPAKCVIVSGTRQLAPVSGARNRCQKMANVSSTLVLLPEVSDLALGLGFQTLALLTSVKLTCYKRAPTSPLYDTRGEISKQIGTSSLSSL